MSSTDFLIAKPSGDVYFFWTGSEWDVRMSRAYRYKTYTTASVSIGRIGRRFGVDDSIKYSTEYEWQLFLGLRG